MCACVCVHIFRPFENCYLLGTRSAVISHTTSICIYKYMYTYIRICTDTCMYIYVCIYM